MCKYVYMYEIFKGNLFITFEWKTLYKANKCSHHAQNNITLYGAAQNEMHWDKYNI